MVQLLKVDQLVQIAAGAGIRLERTDGGPENLYVYTDPDGFNLYVGKNAGKTVRGKRGKRGGDEDRIAEEDYMDRIGVGFSALVKENNAVRHSLWWDPTGFDGQVLLDHIKQADWQGPAIKKLKERLEKGPLATEDVEKILVRIHVVTGRLIGNSQFAGQWESSVNGIHNVIAVLAADIARGTAVLPRLKTLDTPEDMSKGENEDAA